MTTRLERFFAKVDVRGPDECWLWTGHKTKSGHGQFWDGKRHVYAHRFYLGQFYEIPADKFVLHRCNNASCCNWRHLYVGTKKENAQDSIRAGTARPPHPGFGEQHPQSKLTWQSVSEIRALHNNGESMRSLARTHKVCLAAIQKLLSGKTWRTQPSQLS